VIRIGTPSTSNFFPEPIGISLVLATAMGPDVDGASGSGVLVRLETSGEQALSAATAETPTAEVITPRRLIIRRDLLGLPALLQQLPW
jgi:hypothetical protein